jgi:hypothetical protein
MDIPNKCTRPFTALTGLSLRSNSAASKSDIPKPENLDGEMPRKSTAELEAECLRLLAMDPHTRGIRRVEIIRLYPVTDEVVESNWPKPQTALRFTLSTSEFNLLTG